MSHDLSTRQDGRVEFAYAQGESLPWHGLGQEVPAGSSIDVWRAAAGLTGTSAAPWCATQQAQDRWLYFTRCGVAQTTTTNVHQDCHRQGKSTVCTDVHTDVHSNTKEQ